MKIAFLSHLDRNLYLFRLPIMLELLRLGHEVFALSPDGEDLKKMADMGIKTVVYRIERGSLNPFRELSTIRAVYDAVKPLGLDVLHTFTVKPNIYGTIAGTLAKVPLIVNSVTGLGSYYIDDSFKARAVRFVIEMLYSRSFKLSHRVIFQNSDDMRYFVEKGLVDSKKATLIQGSGIDTLAWSPVEKKASDRIIVLMVARALAHKGAREYYEAARLIFARRSDVRFLYAGGVDRGNPSALDERFMDGEKAVEYMGEREDIRQIMAKADIFVLPSYREGMPRTILEACSMGIAVVTTDAPGCNQAVEDGKNGILVPVGDAAGLAAAIERLCDDSALREKMGREGRNKALQEFDVKVVVKKHLKVYGL